MIFSICTFLSVSLVELDVEQRVPGAEQGGVPPTQVKLKERQKFFEEAFQQDMEQYLSTGYLQITERRGESGTRLLLTLQHWFGVNNTEKHKSWVQVFGPLVSVAAGLVNYFQRPHRPSTKTFT